MLFNKLLLQFNSNVVYIASFTFKVVSWSLTPELATVAGKRACYKDKTLTRTCSIWRWPFCWWQAEKRRRRRKDRAGEKHKESEWSSNTDLFLIRIFKILNFISTDIAAPSSDNESKFGVIPSCLASFPLGGACKFTNLASRPIED